MSVKAWLGFGGPGACAATGMAMFILGLVLALPASARAGELTVNSLADPGTGGCDASECTLREAINAAEGATGQDTIRFADGLSGQIQLGPALQPIDTELTIAGPGSSDLAIGLQPDLGVARRIFEIGPDGAAEIAGVTIKDGTVAGEPGGGVLLEGGSLVLREVVVRGTTAIGTTGPARGAGIASIDGELTVVDSQVGAPDITGRNRLIGNGPARGAGIYSEGGSVTLRASTITGNEATPNFGVAVGEGAGIHASGTAVTIERSTISGNQADGSAGFGGGIAIVGSASSLVLDGVTVADNVASEAASLSVPAGADTSVRNSILDAPEGASNCAPDRQLVSAGFNLASDSTCGLDAAGDRQGVDPVLEPLAPNGGPTLSHAIRPGSPALDQGEAGDLMRDQRGLDRTFDDPGAGNAAGGDGTDIGAFEFQPFTMNSTADPGSGGCDLDECTLREAIAASNGSVAADRIEVEPDLAGTITLTDHPPSIEHDLVLEGPGADKLSVDGAGEFRPFAIKMGAHVVLSGIEITGGRATIGGGIANSGRLTLSEVTVRDNRAGSSGAGIDNSNRLVVEDSAIVGNGIVGGGDFHRGGGISSAFDPSSDEKVATHLEVRRSTISGNFIRNADGDPIGRGGAIYVDGPNGPEGPLTGVVVIEDSTLAANTAGRYRERESNLAATLHLEGHASVTVRNSILDAPTGGPHCLHPGPSAFLISEGHNLVSEDPSAGAFHSCAGRIFQPTDPGLGLPSDRLGVDPELLPLADNGGPTPTHAIALSSPAHDQGSSPAERDQRGFERPVDYQNVSNAQDGNGADIGAFELELLPDADLSLTMSDSADPVFEGETVTYTIEVSNAGPVDATAVKVTDTLPSELRFVADGSDQRCGETASGSGVVECDLGTIPANESDTVVIEARAVAPALATNTATALSAAPDPGGAEASEQTRIRPLPTCRGKRATIVSRPGEATVGTDGADVIVGTPGADVIRAGGGDDLVCGRSGNDRVNGGNGSDLIHSGRGRDLVRGGGGADRLFGAQSADRLLGGRGPDLLAGRGGNDTLRGGPGRDACHGGSGRDAESSCEA